MNTWLFQTKASIANSANNFDWIGRLQEGRDGRKRPTFPNKEIMALNADSLGDSQLVAFTVGLAISWLQPT